MRKKWLAIIGSPQKEKNTDVITDLVIEGVEKKGVRVEKVYLGDLRCLPCDGCDGCQKDGVCKMVDELTEVIERVKEVDGYILATPAYNYNMSSQMKVFIDRTSCLSNEENGKRKSRLENGKKAVLVANSQGDKDTIGYSIEGMKRPVEELGVDVIDRIVYTNTRKNPIMGNRGLKEVILSRISSNSMI